jgi:hypothetical protein
MCREEPSTSEPDSSEPEVLLSAADQLLALVRDKVSPEVVCSTVLVCQPLPPIATLSVDFITHER